MVLVNNAFSAAKTNLYRSNVGQPPISNANNQADSPANYCQNMVNVQTPFLANNQTLLAGGPTPVPGTGNNLLTFMANRLIMSFTNLNCQNFGLKNPVTVTLDGNGAAIAATFTTTQQTATATGTTTGGTSGRPAEWRPAPPPRRPPPECEAPGCSRPATPGQVADHLHDAASPGSSRGRRVTSGPDRPARRSRRVRTRSPSAPSGTRSR